MTDSQEKSPEEGKSQSDIDALIENCSKLIMKQKISSALDEIKKANEIANNNPELLPKILAKHVLAFHLNETSNSKFFKEFKQQYDKVQNFDDVFKNALPIIFDDIQTMYGKFLRYIKPNFYSDIGIFTFINQKLASNDEIPYNATELIISIFGATKSNLSRSIKSDFASAALNRMISFAESHFNEKLREIDETKMRSDIDTIKDFLSSSDNKKLQQFEKTLTFKFATSGILSKKFDALQRFNQNKSFSKDLVAEINSAGIISNMMYQMHHDLAAPFVKFLLKLWDAGAYDVKVLSDFWQISIDSMQSVISKFFAVWPQIFNNLPRGKANDFWDIALSSKSYPEACLSFLEKIASKADDNTRSKMVDSLWNASSNDRLTYVNCLTSYVQGSNNSVKKMVDICFNLISENKDVTFALKMLTKIWTSKVSDNVQKDLDLVLEKTNLEQDFICQFVSCVVTFCKSLNDPFTEKELEMIKRQLNFIYEQNLDAFVNFFKSIVPQQKGKIIPKNNVGDILNWMSKLPEIENKAFQIVTFIFETANGIETNDLSSLDLIGMDAMWEIFFRAKHHSVSDYMVDLVIRCTKGDSVVTFVNRCVSKGFGKSTMLALTHLIRKVEDGIDRESLGIKRNLYHQFSHQSSRKDDSSKFKKEELPSQILKTPENAKKLFEILDSDDKELSASALSLLNLMETHSNELSIWKEDKIDWSVVFSMQKPFRLFYRLNTFGNILAENSKSFIVRVFNTGGYKQLMEIMQNGGHKFFIEEKYLKLFLSIVTSLILRCATVEETENLKKEVYKTVGIDNLTNNIFQWILELNDHKSFKIIPSMLAVLRDIVQGESDNFLKNEKFSNFFRTMMFSKDENISKGMANIMLDIPAEKIESIVINGINLSKHGNCTHYYNVLEKVTSTTTNIVDIWKILVETLFNGLFTKSDKKYDFTNLKQKDFEDPGKEYTGDDENILKIRDLHRRKFTNSELLKGLEDTISIVADISFIYGIYNCLLRLSKRFEDKEKVPLAKELIDFSLDRVCLNPFRYVPSPPSLFDLIIELIKKNHKYLASTIEKVNKMILNYDISKENQRYLNRLCENVNVRGLNNMGCTCYLNSSLQQIFRISEVRNEVMKYLPKDEIDTDWLCQLQLLFAKLLYFPQEAIDASNFVKNFKILKKPINPMEQMDAQEFIACLLDKIDESLEEKPVTKYVTGHIQHDTISTMADKPWHGSTIEKFTTLTFDILEQKDVEDSFKTFMIPDVFSGENGYRTDDIGVIDAERYHSICKSPKYLIIQLKRFEFDFQTLTKKKINSKYKFPLKMDISPLLTESKESLDNHLYYNLQGIIIHSGSANGGHYYSFCKKDNLPHNDGIKKQSSKSNGIRTQKSKSDIHKKENLDDDSSSDNDSENVEDWIECNDSTIHNITEQFALENSYGGTSSVSKNERCDSAYMLVYKLSDSSETEEEIEPLCLMPSVMIDNFIQQNMSTVLRNIIFTDSFMKFTNDLVQFNSLNSDILLYNLLDKCSNSWSGERYLQGMSNFMCQRISNSQEFAKYAMKRVIEIHLFMSLVSQNANTRFTWANVASSVINALKKEAKPIVDEILRRFETVFEYWKNFDQFFLPLLTYINLEIEDYDEIIDKTYKLLDVMFHEKFQPKEMESVLNEINLSCLFKILKISIIKGKKLEKYEEKILKNERFMNTWFSCQNSVFDFANLVCLFMKDNKEQTHNYFDIINKSKDKIQTISLASHIANALSFEDSLTNERVDFFFKLLDDKKFDSMTLTQIYRIISTRLSQNRGCSLKSLMRVRAKWLDENLKNMDTRLRQNVICLVKNLFTSVPLWQQKDQNSYIYYPPDNTKPNPNDEEKSYLEQLFDSLSDLTPKMETFYKQSAKNMTHDRIYTCQSTEFYDLFGWVVYSGNLQKKVNEKRDLFLNSIKVLMKLDLRSNAMDIVRFISIISKDNKEFFTPKFFDKFISLLDKLPEPSIDYVSFLTRELFPTITPFSVENYNIILKSKMFSESLEYCLSGKYGNSQNVTNLVEELLKEEKTIEPLSKMIFNGSIFKYHFKAKSTKFIQIAKLLFLKGTIPVEYFYKEKLHEFVFTELSSNVSDMKKSHKANQDFYFYVDILTAFNRAFSSFRPSKSVFNDPEEKLSNFYIAQKDTFFILSNEIQGSTSTPKLAETVLDLFVSIFLTNKKLYKPALSLFDSQSYNRIPRDALQVFTEFRTNLFLLVAVDSNPKESCLMIAKDMNEMNTINLTTNIVSFYGKLVYDLLTRYPKDVKDIFVPATDFFNSFLMNTSDLLGFEGSIGRSALKCAVSSGRNGDITNWISSCLKLVVPVIENISYDEIDNLSLITRQISAAKSFIAECYKCLGVDNPKISNVSKEIAKKASSEVKGKSEDSSALISALDYFITVFN